MHLRSTYPVVGPLVQGNGFFGSFLGFRDSRETERASSSHRRFTVRAVFGFWPTICFLLCFSSFFPPFYYTPFFRPRYKLVCPGLHATHESKCMVNLISFDFSFVLATLIPPSFDHRAHHPGGFCGMSGKGAKCEKEPKRGCTR